MTSICTLVVFPFFKKKETKLTKLTKLEVDRFIFLSRDSRPKSAREVDKSSALDDIKSRKWNIGTVREKKFVCTGTKARVAEDTQWISNRVRAASCVAARGGCSWRGWAISISIEQRRRTAGSCWLRGEHNEEISSEKGMRWICSEGRSFQRPRFPLRVSGSIWSLLPRGDC